MAGTNAMGFRIVLASGLATTALALFGVYLVGQGDNGFQAMGFYINYVIPAGALIVGLLAASGYGAACWFAGVRMSRLLIWVVLLLQVGAYFTAQYIEFASLELVYEDGRPVGFFEYFDFVTRAFAWVEDGKEGEPFGVWGYAMRALEIGGFALGGIIVPAILWKRPYCDSCSAYYRSKRLGLLPGGVKPQKVKKLSAEARKEYEESDERVKEQGLETVKTLFEEAEQGNVEACKALLAEHAGHQKAIQKLTGRIGIDGYRCPRCDRGFLRATAMTGQGDKTQSVEIGDSAQVVDVSGLM